MWMRSLLSVSTIGYTRTDEKDELDNPENEKEDNEVITIDDLATEANGEISKEHREKESNGEEIMVIEETKEPADVNDPWETSTKVQLRNQMRRGHKPVHL